MRYSESLGYCGIAIVLAIKSLKVNPAEAIDQINAEIEYLAQFPEPDARRVINTVKGCLLQEDWAHLRAVREYIEAGILLGSEAEPMGILEIVPSLQPCVQAS